MAKITAQEAASKWSRNLGAATADIQRGVERVTEAPGPKAAARKDLYVRRVQERSDTWAAKLRSQSVEDWRRPMIDKGITRIADGAAKAEGKMGDFFGQLLPHVDAGRAKINAMPKGSLADSKARASAWIDHMAQFRQRSGG